MMIDHVSRKAGVVLATCILIVGVALCTGSYSTTPHMMFCMLVVSRGILGFGAGGEYPCVGIVVLSWDSSDALPLIWVSFLEGFFLYVF
ncbi:hypothetical protein Malapachy_2047 [Malassezia pachydermatis]|uniref:Major facilitator superfamily (MFS) profile domain-containing protein n=1 Tax=Malassezia pachydermatis TaxID=77020 RepID=A0A0M8MU48_9BASI|nr:hypothetical protein Malapachy_2047 [Malassezia pachydermatis]KOS13850.1 hypothetical protein Malapachy_2047 [Malassezia pachydermatis]